MPKFDQYIVPDLSSKVIFITGGTAGLGKQTVVTLAAHKPSHIFFSGRNKGRAESLIAELNESYPHTKFVFISCDLASLGSVTEAAQSFLTQSKRLDVLICNAGIMATPPALTADGYEIQFGTNHMGHALLIKHLLPLLETTADGYGDARVVSLTSLGAGIIRDPGIDFGQFKTTMDRGFGAQWTRYGFSKLANILYSQQLAKRHPRITTASVHPGVIKTDLVGTLGFWERLVVYVSNIGSMISPAQGVQNSVWAATVDKKILESGAFYEPVGEIGRKTKCSADTKLAEKLWDWTQDEIKGYKL